jgi:hypothetical protein
MTKRNQKHEVSTRRIEAEDRHARTGLLRRRSVDRPGASVAGFYFWAAELCPDGLCPDGFCAAGLCPDGFCAAGFCAAGLCPDGFCAAGLWAAGLSAAGLCTGGGVSDVVRSVAAATGEEALATVPVESGTVSLAGKRPASGVLVSESNLAEVVVTPASADTVDDEKFGSRPRTPAMASEPVAAAILIDSVNGSLSPRAESGLIPVVLGPSSDASPGGTAPAEPGTSRFGRPEVGPPEVGPVASVPGEELCGSSRTVTNPARTASTTAPTSVHSTRRGSRWTSSDHKNRRPAPTAPQRIRTLSPNSAMLTPNLSAMLTPNLDASSKLTATAHPSNT